MKRQEKRLISYLKKGLFVLTLHAQSRMNERYVTEADIIFVAKNFKKIRYQETRATFLVEGKTEWGDWLSISAALRDEVVIVTVFFKGEL